MSLHIHRCNSEKHSALGRMRGQFLAITLCLLTCLPAILSPLQANNATQAQAVNAAAQLAVAASFRSLWPELSERYIAETGSPEPLVSFASSGLLTTQIRHGAPFELFLSADQHNVQLLHSLGKTPDKGTALAYGSLTLMATINIDPLSLETPLHDLATTLDQRQNFKLAIPNPQHAPYGVAAQQALEQAGVWPLSASQLLKAENAAQTLQFVLTGAVQFAIVPSTLISAQTDGKTPAASAASHLQKLPIDSASHVPVTHQMVLMDGAGSQAQRFYQWLQSNSAAEVLSRYGLIPAH